MRLPGLLFSSNAIGWDVITRTGDSICLTVLGLDAATAYVLASILCRRLDTTMRMVHLFVDLFPQAKFMCGWALMYRWYERYDKHDSIHSYEEDLEDLPSWRYALVRKMFFTYESCYATYTFT